MSECFDGGSCGVGGFCKRCPEILFGKVADLEKQLAGKDREIEADDRNVINLMDQVHALSQEIERMRPVVEAAIGLRHDDYMDVPTYFERAVDEYEKSKP